MANQSSCLGAGPRQRSVPRPVDVVPGSQTVSLRMTERDTSGGPMKNLILTKRRQLLLVVAAAWLIASNSTPALAETSFTVKGVKVLDQWIVPQTDMKLAEAPGNVRDDKNNQTRFGFLDNQESFDRLWKSWRKGDPPKVDFAKYFVLVLTHPENARVDFTVTLDDKGTLNINVIATERVPRGMTYVIAVLERGGIKSVGKTPLKPGK